MTQQRTTRDAFGLSYHALENFMENFSYNFIEHQEQDHEVVFLRVSVIIPDTGFCDNVLYSRLHEPLARTAIAQPSRLQT